jgi:hypothetical protein
MPQVSGGNRTLIPGATTRSLAIGVPTQLDFGLRNASLRTPAWVDCGLTSGGRIRNPKSTEGSAGTRTPNYCLQGRRVPITPQTPVACIATKVNHLVIKADRGFAAPSGTPAVGFEPTRPALTARRPTRWTTLVHPCSCHGEGGARTHGGTFVPLRCSRPLPYQLGHFSSRPSSFALRPSHGPRQDSNPHHPVTAAGFEARTGTEAPVQLSNRPREREELNLRLPSSQPGALSPELLSHTGGMQVREAEVIGFEPTTS